MIKFIAILFSLLLLIAFPIDPTQAALQNYSYADLKGRSFANEKLTGGVFLGAEMREVDFSNADLTGAIFSKGVLLGANLHGADLTNSLMDQVTLDEADLSDALLIGSTMTRTRFLATGIKGADFTDALIDRAQVKLLCEVANGTNSRTGVSTKESLGCP